MYFISLFPLLTGVKSYKFKVSPNNNHLQCEVIQYLKKKI
jgi:hypothetical protein